MVEHEGQALVTLVCAHAAHSLTEFPANASARALYERHIQATDGVHLVMVADESTTEEVFQDQLSGRLFDGLAFNP